MRKVCKAFPPPQSFLNFILNLQLHFKIELSTNVKFVLHLKESKCRFNYGNDNFASFIERIFWGKL